MGSDGYKKIKGEVAGLFPKFNLGLKDGIAEYFEVKDDYW